MGMSYLCPVCNGFEELRLCCKECQGMMDDQGRLSDYYGPYSPYRPIDDLKLTNGFEDDFQSHVCLHWVQCQGCSEQYHIAIQEQQM